MPVSLAKPWECWGRGHLGSFFPPPWPSRPQKCGGLLVCICSSLLVEPQHRPAHQSLSSPSHGFTHILLRLVLTWCGCPWWGGLVDTGRTKCRGFCVRFHVGVKVRVHRRRACASAAQRLTAQRLLTQKHCQLFPLNTTPPLHPPPRHLGKLSRLLMRSHMLMSSDVSGIPSFCPPPFSLCHFPLGAFPAQA